MPAPPRVAILGSGPGGFYTAKFLLRLLPSASTVHILERLPAPFGLVRYGVAPDHPEVKNVAQEFKTLVKESGGRLRCFLNVPSVSLALLRQHYHSVVVATGAPGDRFLGLPGEQECLDAGQMFSARQLVMLYNSHPSSTHLHLPSPLPAQRALLLGHGNVAMDIARILTSPPTALLKATDISRRFCEWSANTIGRSFAFDVVGRRGYFDAAFTNKEFRELLSIPNTRATIDPSDFGLPNPSADLDRFLAGKLSDPKLVTRAKKRGTDIVRTMIDNHLKQPKKDQKTVNIKFNWEPQTFSREKGALFASFRRPQWFPGGAIERLFGGYDMAVQSVGFSVQPPFAELPVDSSTKGISHKAGKVEGFEDVFVAGWAKRGPKGVIAANIPCCQETAVSLARSLNSDLVQKREIDIEGLFGKSVFSMEDWVDKAEEEEARRGLSAGRSEGVSEKLQTVDELVEALGAYPK